MLNILFYFTTHKGMSTQNASNYRPIAANKMPALAIIEKRRVCTDVVFLCVFSENVPRKLKDVLS